MSKIQYPNSSLLKCILHVNLGVCWGIKYESWFMTNKLWVTRQACLNVSLDLNFVILIWLLQVHLAHYRFSSSFEVWIDLGDGFWLQFLVKNCWQILMTINWWQFFGYLEPLNFWLFIGRAPNCLIKFSHRPWRLSARSVEIKSESDDF